MSFWNSKKKEETKENLLNALLNVYHQEDAQAILEALEAYVEIRIEDATSDLDDRINKRGEWDPDY